MKRNKIDLTRVINIACAVLMLALLICQFVPFWSLGDQQASIGGYIWFPEHHGDLTAHFQKTLNDRAFDAGDIVGTNIMIIVASVIGVIFCLKNAEDAWPAIFPAVCGIAGLYGCIAKPVFRLGAMWPLHLVLSIVMLALAVVSLLCWIKGKPTEE